MWSEAFQRLRDKEEFEKEAEQKGLSQIELKIQKKEERLNSLKGQHFLGADSIKEYRNLEKEIEGLKKQNSYEKWFAENKTTLEVLFDDMFKKFTIEHWEQYELRYSTDAYVAFWGQVFQEDWLIKLLKRYGYTIDKTIDETGQQKLVITIK